MNKPSTLRIITVVAPLLCAILAIVLSAFEVRRLHALEDQRTQLKQQITSLDNLAREIQARPPLSKLAAAPPSPDEQPLFLNLVRQFADLSRVQLVKYENKTVPPPAQGSAEAKTSALPSGVVALTSSVEVAGEYNQVREFMTALWRSPRLFNATDLKWSASDDKWPATRLAFTLTRYVHTPAAAALDNPPGARRPGVLPGAASAAGTIPGASVVPGATMPGAMTPGATIPGTTQPGTLPASGGAIGTTGTTNTTGAANGPQVLPNSDGATRALPPGTLPAQRRALPGMSSGTTSAPVRP